MTKLSTNCKTFHLMAMAFKSQKGVVSRTATVLYRDSTNTLHGNISSRAISNITGNVQHLCGCYMKNNDLTSRYMLYSPLTTTRHFVTSSEGPEKKPSLYQRFKSMYRDYWYVLLPVHMVTSAAWFGGFYMLAKSGVDIVGLMETLNLPDKVINPFRNGHSTTGYLAIALALYKIATPLRYTVTIGGTTVSINYMKKWGYIKPVPTKEELKEMYAVQKQLYNDKKQAIKDNMIQTFKTSTNE